MSTSDVPQVTDYRLAPPVAARLVGAYLIAFAIVVFAVTIVLTVAGINADLLVLLLAIGLIGLFGFGWWLRGRLSVVRLTPTGYRVRMVRAAGVTEARWSDVEDAVATAPRDIPCVVLRLKDGRSTTIPVGLVAADKDDFARDVRDHLRRAAR